jgi:hypothetical protein
MPNSYNGIPINCAKNTHEVVFGLIGKGHDARIVDVPSGAGAFTARLKDNGLEHAFAIDVENLLAFGCREA